MADSDDWLTLAEAARLVPGPRSGTHTHPTTLRRWIRAGRLPAWRRGRWMFVRKGDVLALVEPVRVEPGEQVPVLPVQSSAWTQEVLRRHGLA